MAGLLGKVFRFPLTLLMLEVAIIGATATLASMALHRLGANGSALHFLGALGVTLAVVLAFWACKCWIEQSANAEFALAGAGPELLAGLAIGFGLFSAAALTVSLLGGLEILGLRGMGQFWSMLAMAIVSGVFEETLFRGVLFRHIETMLGSWVALGVTAAIVFAVVSGRFSWKMLDESAKATAHTTFPRLQPSAHSSKPRWEKVTLSPIEWNSWIRMTRYLQKP